MTIKKGQKLYKFTAIGEKEISKLAFTFIYQECEVIRENKLSFKVKNIESEGCFFGTKISKNEINNYFTTKEEIIKKIKENIPILIEEIDETLREYTELSPYYHYLIFKKQCVEYLLKSISKGNYINAKLVKKVNVKSKMWSEECKNKIKKKMRE